MQRRLVTINAVAAEAGVSPSTVSRVLNGGAGKIGISPDVSERVRAAAQRLHYAPNQAARSLARRHTGAVTLLIGRISATLGTDIATGVTKVAARHGYHVNVLFVGAADQKAQLQALTYLRSGVCDGLLVASGSHCLRGPAGDALVELVESGMPVSVVLAGGPSPGVPSVDVDHGGGAYLATMHLIGLGHRRIARFAADEPLPPNDSCPQAARHRGYLRALDAAGIVADPRWAFGGDREMADGVDMVRALLGRFPDRADRPTAIVALSDQIAIGALRGLYETGIAVPDEIAVVGMDGNPAAPFATPALTMVEHPRVELGEMAAEALFSQLVGKRAPAHEAIVPMSLVVRESCGAPRRHEGRTDDRTDGAPSGTTYTTSGGACGQRRSTMSFAQRVREALDRQGVPPSTANQEGYHVDEAPDDLIIVRWGCGEPFHGLQANCSGDGLTACAVALKSERFLVAPNPFEDADGRFIAVRESSR